MIYDISRSIGRSLAGWPGDTLFEFTEVSRMKDGSSCNVGSFNISCHFGTHMDAPYHYIDDAKRVDELNPETFIGPAAIIEACGDDLITTDHFENVDFTKISRVLIRTGVWTDSAIFPTRWPLLSEDVPDFLGKHGVKLLGLDVPSVDSLYSKEMTIHGLLGKNKILIVESLDLGLVPPGTYELIALPLKIVGADGSPVRAILRDLEVTSPAGNRMLGQ